MVNGDTSVAPKLTSAIINKNTVLSEEIRIKTNEKLLDHLMKLIRSNLTGFSQMKKKILFTYNVTIVLYIVLFVLGVLLLSVPLYYAYFKGDIAVYNSLISGGLGITDLVVLFVFKPVERIHNSMSDIGQITIITSSYQEQEALRLLELDATDNTSIGEAAEYIGKAAANSVNLLQIYCEGPTSEATKSEKDQKSTTETTT